MKEAHKGRGRKKVHLPEPTPPSSESKLTPAPPPAGEGKPWRLLLQECETIDPHDPAKTLSCTFGIPRGMRVHQQCCDAYWDAHQLATDALGAFRAVGIDPPYPYLLVNKGNDVVGHGAFASGEDSDDMAWIACMFLEMRLRLAFALPEGATPSRANLPVAEVS
jgi:hypothetical protein